MKQLISEPTHISQQSSSCIDLSFTNQPNIVIDSGVDNLLKTQCKNRAEVDLINRAIENCD